MAIRLNLSIGDMGDAVIICGSSVGQVKANVDACSDESPLPKVGSRRLPEHFEMRAT